MGPRIPKGLGVPKNAECGPPDRRQKLLDAIKKAGEDPDWKKIADQQEFPNPWYGSEKSQSLYLAGAKALNKHMSLLSKD